MDLSQAFESPSRAYETPVQVNHPVFEPPAPVPPALLSYLENLQFHATVMPELGYGKIGETLTDLKALTHNDLPKRLEFDERLVQKLAWGHSENCFWTPQDPKVVFFVEGGKPLRDKNNEWAKVASEAWELLQQAKERIPIIVNPRWNDTHPAWGLVPKAAQALTLLNLRDKTNRKKLYFMEGGEAGSPYPEQPGWYLKYVKGFGPVFNPLSSPSRYGEFNLGPIEEVEEGEEKPTFYVWEEGEKLSSPLPVGFHRNPNFTTNPMMYGCRCGHRRYYHDTDPWQDLSKINSPPRPLGALE